MDLRKAKRYILHGKDISPRDMADVRCQFDFDPKLNGVLVDLGIGGFGIEIHDLTGSQAEHIQKLDTFIMTIYFENEFIMASVRNIWNRLIFGEGRMFLKGGVAINIISPEDRLKLSGIIEKIRSSQ